MLICGPNKQIDLCRVKSRAQSINSRIWKLYTCDGKQRWNWRYRRLSVRIWSAMTWPVQKRPISVCVNNEREGGDVEKSLNLLRLALTILLIRSKWLRMTEPPEGDKFMSPAPEARSLPWLLQTAWCKTKVFLFSVIFSDWGFKISHHYFYACALIPFSDAVTNGDLFIVDKGTSLSSVIQVREGTINRILFFAYRSLESFWWDSVQHTRF